MSTAVLKAVAVRAQAPAPTWDQLEFVLRVVGHGYARWEQRGAERAAPVERAVERLAELRGPCAAGLNGMPLCNADHLLRGVACDPCVIRARGGR
jgi:hypothetical protein